ncbi:MAG: hypothetical protein ACXADF_18420, partial [Candidatus Thorarchaeota archaeon]
DQKLEYTYNMKGGQTITVTGTAISFTADDASVATTIKYTYTGDYLLESFTLLNEAAAPASGDIIQSYTKYNGQYDQKLEYTYNMKGGQTITVTGTAISFTADDATVATTIKYAYVGDYLLESFTLLNEAAAPASGDVIQSYTKYNGQYDQKLEYTYNMKGGQTITVTGTTITFTADDATVATTIIYTYVGDYLKESITLLKEAAAPVSGDVIQSYTKYNGQYDQKLEYTYNMKADQQITVTGTTISFTATDATVATTITYAYTGDYLLESFTLLNEAAAPASGDIIQSYTKYNGQYDQKLEYTYNMKGGQAITVTGTAISFTADDATVATTIKYTYTGDYLLESFTLLNEAATPASGDVIQSYTKYNGQYDQKLEYTYNMKGGQTITVTGTVITFTADDASVATTIKYTYTGDYLLESFTLLNEAAAPASGDIIQSYTKYNGQYDQKLEYTYNMKADQQITVTGTTITFTADDASIATTITYSYVGDYLLESFTLLNEAAAPASGDVIQSYTKYNGQYDQKLEYTYNMKGGQQITVTGTTITFTADDASVATTIKYAYTGDYLLESFTLLNEAAAPASGDVIQSYTKYNGQYDQKLEYTYNMKGGQTITVSGTTIIFTADDATVATTIKYTYTGDYLLESFTLLNEAATPVSGDVIQSYTKYNGQYDQKLEYTYNMKADQQITVTGTAISFTADDATVATTIKYAYVGDYLLESFTLLNEAAAPASGDIIQSYTKYNGQYDQKLEYTYNMKGGQTITVTGTAISFTADDASVATTIIYTYVGDYLLESFTLLNEAAAPVSGDVIQSYTKYNGQYDQKLEYTYNMKGGQTITVTGTTITFTADDATVATTIKYTYTGDYLLESFTLLKEAAAPVSGDVIQSYTKYNGQYDQKLEYTYNMKADQQITVTGTAISFTADDASIATTIKYAYVGDYLKESFTLLNEAATPATGDVIQSYTKYNGQYDQKLEYTYNMKGGQTITVTGTAISFTADDATVATTIKYAYVGDYLLESFTLLNEAAAPVTGDIIQSYTKYNGQYDQKLEYTYNMKGGQTITVTGTAISFTADDASVATTIKY